MLLTISRFLVVSFVPSSLWLYIRKFLSFPSSPLVVPMRVFLVLQICQLLQIARSQVKNCYDWDGTMRLDYPCDPSANVSTVVLSPLKLLINSLYDSGQLLLWKWRPVCHELVLRYGPKCSGRGHLHRSELDQ